MKDVELLTLKSFTYAVIQQKDLPEDIRQHIQTIASSSDMRVAELGSLARESPLLAPDYRWAYRYLTNRAAERGLGAAVLPADYDEDGPANEPSNIVSATERYQIEEDEKTLEAIGGLTKADPKDVQQALLSKNPLQALINLINRFAP